MITMVEIAHNQTAMYATNERGSSVVTNFDPMQIKIARTPEIIAWMVNLKSSKTS